MESGKLYRNLQNIDNIIFYEEDRCFRYVLISKGSCLKKKIWGIIPFKEYLKEDRYYSSFKYNEYYSANDIMKYDETVKFNEKGNLVSKAYIRIGFNKNGLFEYYFKYFNSNEDLYIFLDKLNKLLNQSNIILSDFNL